MSRNGNCWDNAVAESFFGTLEQEIVGLGSTWADEHSARDALPSDIHGCYNDIRRHSTLGYHSPVNLELFHRQPVKAAASLRPVPSALEACRRLPRAKGQESNRETPQRSGLLNRGKVSHETRRPGAHPTLEG